MKRWVLILGIVFVPIFVTANESFDKKLNICVVNGDKGVFVNTTIKEQLDSGSVALQKKSNNKIILTHSDIRGTKSYDFIFQKIQIKNKKSCYLVDKIYDYSKRKYRDGYIGNDTISFYGGADRNSFFSKIDITKIGNQKVDMEEITKNNNKKATNAIEKRRINKLAQDYSSKYQAFSMFKQTKAIQEQVLDQFNKHDKKTQQAIIDIYNKNNIKIPGIN